MPVTAKKSEELEKTAVMIESTNKEIEELQNATKTREEVLQRREAKEKLTASKRLGKEVRDCILLICHPNAFTFTSVAS